MADLSSSNPSEMHSIQEVAALSGLSVSTLHYYEEAGLIPPITRDSSSGHRRYSQADLDLIESLANLRAVGMSLDEMRAYLQLRPSGDDTAREKRELFARHADKLRRQLKQLRAQEQYLSFKVSYWDARARGDIAAADALAQDYQSIIKNLKSKK